MAGENEQAAAPAAAVDETDDDFNAGFAPAAGPTETPEPVATPEPTAAPAPTPAPTEPPKYAQITEGELNDLRSRASLVDEIRSTSKKQFDTAFGKIGALEQVLTKLQTATPAGENVTIDEADFEDLAAQYPDLGPLTVKGMNKALAKFKGTGGADPATIEKMVTDRVNEATAKVREEAIDVSLETAFPGWKQDVKTDSYKTWIAAQPDDVKALEKSVSHGDAARLLRDFYKALNAPAPAPAPTPAPTPAPSRTRQQQIAAAVPPKGDGGHPPGPSEDDEFAAGFKSG